jgi:hypothetical protein
MHDVDHPEELDVEDLTCGREEEGQAAEEDSKTLLAAEKAI